MRRTNIYLPDDLTRALDEIADDEGVSRAEVVRRLLVRGLAGSHTDLDADLAAITSSAGVLANVHAPARAADGRAAHLDRVWRQHA